MSRKPKWWEVDTYDLDTLIPDAFKEFEGPNGLALVRAWDSGQTSKGWGLNPPKNEKDGFMPRYMRGEHNPRKTVPAYNKGLSAAAFVMRSLRLVCVDIDGKNGGLDHVTRLGALPPTLAETSKSGNGYHLFYYVDDEWDDELGYAMLGDRIGIEQGVDFRATGCVYHYHQQRWNSRPIAKLPEHIATALIERQRKTAASKQRVRSTVDSQDEMEILMMQAELEAELAKPVPDGKRNNTMFAIGSQMAEAGVENWSDKIVQRSTEIGLSDEEAEKIAANISTYTGVAR